MACSAAKVDRCR